MSTVLLSPRAKPKIPPPFPFRSCLPLSLFTSLLCFPSLYTTLTSAVRRPPSWTRAFTPPPFSLFYLRYRLFSISGRPVYQNIIAMPINIYPYFFLQNIFLSNVFLSLRKTNNLFRARSIRPFLLQTHLSLLFSGQKAPYMFRSTLYIFTAVWRSLTLKHVFSTDFNLIYTPSCNSHCQPFMTASIPYFLFLICYALPPTTSETINLWNISIFEF